MVNFVLNGQWDVTGIAPDGKEMHLNGTVPGSALNDVLCSGLENITDIFWRDHAEQVQKYETYDWVYTKRFVAESDIREGELVFEKLDTYCDVYFNQQHLGYCDNGFVRHTFHISNIQKGENLLEVYFYSPISQTRGKKPRKGSFTTVDRLYTRRPQCTYGWDWAMRFVTCGISGNVSIKTTEPGIKIKNAYVYTKNIDSYSASIGIDIVTEDFESGEILTYEIFDEDSKLVRTVSKYCEEPFARIDLDITNPKLWYPLGYGEQNIYRLMIKAQGIMLYETVFGIRTVKILEAPDEPGSANYNKCLELKKVEKLSGFEKNETFTGFLLLVNGIKIMCKGANWVPCEPFYHGNTDKKVTEILTLAANAGVNMLRVWGGGDFETDHFYDECSRLGIMVTQDFLMACGQYPEKEARFLEQLQKESAYICERLRNKPCLMWWTGDNENAVRGYDSNPDYIGRNAAYKGIAPLLYKMDPYRRFFPSSPYGGKCYGSSTVGTTHNTFFLGDIFRFIETTDAKKYKEFFKNLSARFIAEEPCLGAVSEESLAKIMTEQEIYDDKLDMWRYHTKTNPALAKEIFDYMLIFAEKLLGHFKDPKDRLFKLQYMQYEWIRVSFERVRREKWFCSGVIYWMLNDCWPAASGWALIDYYNKPKAGYYAFKRCAKPIVLSLDSEEGLYKLYVSNDGEAQKLALRWYAISADGKIQYISPMQTVDADENAAVVGLEIKEADVPENCFIIAEAVKEKVILDRTIYKKENLQLQEAEGQIEVTFSDSNGITVKSDTYIHVVRLEGDALFEDNFFSLMPGETKEIRVMSNPCSDIKATAYTVVM